MANHHGDFIWYELITSDPDAASAFYSPMLGWSIADSGMPDLDYRIASTVEAPIAGIMRPPAGASMPSAWLGYINVDDVDGAVASIRDAGGAVHMEPSDIPGVGRLALVADPQGALFYVMKGESSQESLAFSYDMKRPGHCAWNELATSDPGAAMEFYSTRFGWTKDGEMDMGPMGAYEFLRHAGRAPAGSFKGMLGAIMPKPAQMPMSAWSFYFRVPDIDVAVAHIKSAGGTIVQEPMEIPGGDFAMNGVDPQGAHFALVGARNA